MLAAVLAPRASQRSCPSSATAGQTGMAEPIMARVVSDLMQGVGISHIVTVDLHTAQIEGYAAQRSRFLLIWNESDMVAQPLRGPRLERAIGVIYRPETERRSHYFQARLPDQFDAVLHFDETRAVEPLELTAEWEVGEVPETFPFAV
jgi:hypothetical protein